MKKYLIILVFIFALALPALALDVPPKAGGYVNDYADMLSGDAQYKLEQALANYEAQTSNQLVLATFPSMEGDSLEDFSIRLAEAWGVGTKENDNGIILLIFRDDRKMRIEVGYGLEDMVTDATAGLIINNEIAPYFKEAEYERGILAGLSAIIDASSGKYEGTGRSAYQRPGKKPSAGQQLLMILLFLFFPMFFRFFLFGVLFRGFGFGGRGAYGGYGGFGGGGGGGFGGFGGGGFGGGGASGGW